MAVGFAQGNPSRSTGTGETEDTLNTTYTVIRKNAHAWPEVYFPGIGWVEFEPTGNQDQLNRPFLPRELDSANNPSFANRNLPQEDQVTTPDPNTDQPIDQASGLTSRLTPTLYLILFLAAFTPDRKSVV